ncbi:MAG: sigma-70 family RNA polymerase sigma factor [Bacteroidota bacterium]
MSAAIEYSIAPPASLVLHINTTEMELVSAMRSGDQRSLTKVYNMYSGALLGIISKIIRDNEVAEDILQETFVKIWKHIDSFDPSKGRLFTWMARLAKNSAIDQCRSRAHINCNKNYDLDDLHIEADKARNTSNNPDHIGIRQLTQHIKGSQKLILDLIYFEGYTQSEAAEELNIPIGTVKTRLRMAIQTLRGLF